MEYIYDSNGQEILLKDKKFQVMMEWEKPYMEACIDALQPFGDVLEIGFGCGYSATRIQHYAPKSHTIIEYHPIVAQRARKWAENFPNVTIIEDTWQHALTDLKIFDAIFFDDYPLENEKQMEKLEEKQQQGHTALYQGKRVMEEADEKLPFLKTLVYTDADLDELIICCRKEPGVAPYVFRFLNELRLHGQITAAQESGMLERLAEMDIIPPCKPESPQSSFQFRGPNERLLTFLQLVLNNHMRSGSRFSCFLSSAVSKYEDPQFVEAIICNPYLDYTEHWIDVVVPSHCDYYTGSKALVMTITRR